MAIKIPKILTGADAKSRVFLIAIAVAGVGVALYAAVHYLGGGGTAGGGSSVAGTPALQTVPGGQMTPEFYRAVVQANAQSAKQAQITGGSAVPTLINVPGQQSTGFPSTNCTIVCPSDENVNVADDINQLIKDGKLSEQDGNMLLNLAKNNVPIDQYADALNELVRQGKLTPEQARALLEKYKKQHANALRAESGAVMDGLIKSGALPLDTANALLALQKSGVSPADYAAELNRLVKEGKISPETAAKLLAQYTQQQMREQAKEGAYQLQKMAQSGGITADVAKTLADLQSRNVPVADYEAELNRLVKEGKLTPEAAAKLLAAYKKQHGALGTMGTLDSLVKKAQNDTIGLLNDLVKNNKLSPEEANAILNAEKNLNNPVAFQAALSDLSDQKIKKGELTRAQADALLGSAKIAKNAEERQAVLAKALDADKALSPEDRRRILASGAKLAAMTAEAEKLAAMQANNAPVNDYVEELKRAVAAGLISPEEAKQLLDQYRALTAPFETPTVAGPGVQANIPGAAEFARLQQTVEKIPPPAAAAAPTFTPPPAPVEAVPTGETPEQRQARLDAMKTAMSNQAQQLIASWQPTPMLHKEGTYEKPKPGTTTTTTTTTTKGGGAGGMGGKTPPAPVLIKAGTILFAILETTVDSDYPDTPVMATVVMGDLKGAKVMGKLALAQGMDKVSLNFTLMNKDEWPASKSINAFAIDPDTARTVMASNVDYHYLKRFGAIMATSFLSGYSNAITTAGSNTTTGIFGTSTTHPNLSSGSKIAVGLGQIGTTLGAQVSSYINTPVTVKVYSGVGIGILFMADVTL